MKKIHFIIVAIAMMSACSSNQTDRLDQEEYAQWMSSNTYLTKVKKSRYVDIQARYLPSDYMAWKEVTQQEALEEGTSFDSLKKIYSDAMYFEVIVQSNEKGMSNLLQQGALNYADYKERVNKLNFHANDFIELSIDGKTYEPVLFHFESASELSNRLVFHLAFVPEKGQEAPERYQLTFEDPYWHSGINHFTFSSKHINNTPKLVLI